MENAIFCLIGYKKIMKEMINIRRSDLIKLLEQSFDEGWGGYLDLKDATVERLLEEYLDKQEFCCNIGIGGSEIVSNMSNQWGDNSNAITITGDVNAGITAANGNSPWITTQT